MKTPGQRRAPHRATNICGAILALVVVAYLGSVAFGEPAKAASTESKLESAREKLQQAEHHEGVLTSTLANYSERIGGLQEQLSTLREREAFAREELGAKQGELDRAGEQLERAEEELEAARARLKGALEALRQRVVAIYESGSPDVLSVLLSSANYSDMAATSEYLTRIQQQDEAMVGRVSALRNQAEGSVERQHSLRERIKSARDQIASREREIVEAQSSVEGRQAQLVAVRAQRRRTLDRVEVEADHFGANVEALQQKIAEEITQASAPVPQVVAPPTGGASSSGLIWPVEGVITSGFGPRWGSFHPGLDIGVPEGTPIKAAASGTVVLMQSEAESGGYGNYTCIDHGGGLSTCYAHQTSFATSLGASVTQGEVIGYVGSTGFSTGPHLHFEVRVNGEPQDPLGYL